MRSIIALIVFVVTLSPEPVFSQGQETNGSQQTELQETDDLATATADLENFRMKLVEAQGKMNQQVGEFMRLKAAIKALAPSDRATIEDIIRQRNEGIARLEEMAKQIAQQHQAIAELERNVTSTTNRIVELEKRQKG